MFVCDFMKRFSKISRPIILTILVFNQLYFSLLTLDKTDENKSLTRNGTFIETSFNIYESKANLNNKVSGCEKLLSTEKFSSERFYNIVLTIAEETAFLFFINSEKNSNSLLSVITNQTIPRSPPLS